MMVMMVIMTKNDDIIINIGILFPVIHDDYNHDLSDENDNNSNGRTDYINIMSKMI